MWRPVAQRNTGELSCEAEEAGAALKPIAFKFHSRMITLPGLTRRPGKGVEPAPMDARTLRTRAGSPNASTCTNQASTLAIKSFVSAGGGSRARRLRHNARRSSTPMAAMLDSSASKSIYGHGERPRDRESSPRHLQAEKAEGSGQAPSAARWRCGRLSGGLDRHRGHSYCEQALLIFLRRYAFTMSISLTRKAGSEKSTGNLSNVLKRNRINCFAETLKVTIHAFA